MEQEHILVIDDEEGLLQLVKMRLNAMGFAVTACTSGRDAVHAAKTNRFDLAITDLRLRGEDGLDVTEELLRIHPGLPVIILTAHGSIPNAVEAVQRGAFGYLDQALRRQRAESEDRGRPFTSTDEPRDTTPQVPRQRALWNGERRGTEPGDAAAPAAGHPSGGFRCHDVCCSEKLAPARKCLLVSPMPIAGGAKVPLSP